MTQVKSAQPKRTQLAWKQRAEPRTLAQRRADLAAQQREMALADLEQVAARLRELHARLERQTGRKWTEMEIADGANVAYRTYQAWIGAKNENASGKGYDKLARFYRRKLGDKGITRQWIVFGEEPERKEVPDLMAELDAGEQKRLNEIEQRLGGVEDAVQRVLAILEDRRREELEDELAQAEHESAEGPPSRRRAAGNGSDDPQAAEH